MFQTLYEEIVRFGSEGELKDELALARQEYVQRTGEMFETDATFERRIAAFLEWYALDRKVSSRPDRSIVDLFLEARATQLSEADRQRVMGLSRTVLSLFEFKRAKPDQLVVIDLLSNEKLRVFERRKPAGLEPGDVLEARVVPYDGMLLFSDAYTFQPREARKAILKAAKRFRKVGEPSRFDLVHRVAYLANRCERYKHVDPKQIFAELEAKAA